MSFLQRAPKSHRGFIKGVLGTTHNLPEIVTYRTVKSSRATHRKIDTSRAHHHTARDDTCNHKRHHKKKHHHKQEIMKFGDRKSVV